MIQRNMLRLPGDLKSSVLARGVILAGLGQLAFLAGCDRAEIHSYRVAREFDGSSVSVVEQKPPPQTEHAGVIWTVPPSWTEVETTSSMRIATFIAANGQEIAITAFPGDVGGLIANVNRWRGQIGLDPIEEQDLSQDTSRLELNDVDVIIVDISGETLRLIGSVVNIGDGQTWFAKAMGPADVVEQVKADLTTFSASLHIHTDGHTDGHTSDDGHNHDHDGHDHDGGDHDHDHAQAPAAPESASESAPEPVQERVVWEAPPQWVPEENASTILMAAYLSESGARITLTSLAGNGGGPLGNINRWRGQLGLPPVTSLENEGLKDLGSGAVFVDLVAPDESARMAAGIVPAGGQTLFFKLTGSVSAVGAELERFEAYINAQGLGKAGAP